MFNYYNTGPAGGAAATAALFDINKKVQDYNGSTDKWDQFQNEWSLAVNIMKAMGMEKSHMLMELKKVLHGSALAVVKPIELSDVGYDLAMMQLSQMAQTRDSAVLRAVRKLIEKSQVKIQKPSERESVLSDVLSYYNVIKTYNLSGEARAWALERYLIESRMDDFMTNMWHDGRRHRYDPTHPLRFLDSPGLLIDIFAQAQSEAAVAAPPKITSGALKAAKDLKVKTQKALTAAKAELANAVAAGTPKKKDKKEGKEKDKARDDGPFDVCPFCSKRNHKYPRQCTLLRGSEKLEDKEIQKIAKKKSLCRNCFAKSGCSPGACKAPPYVICGIDGCEGRHHSSHHGKKKQQQTKHAQANAASAGKTKPSGEQEHESEYPEVEWQGTDRKSLTYQEKSCRATAGSGTKTRD